MCSVNAYVLHVFGKLVIMEIVMIRVKPSENQCHLKKLVIITEEISVVMRKFVLKRFVFEIIKYNGCDVSSIHQCACSNLDRTLEWIN